MILTNSIYCIPLSLSLSLSLSFWNTYSQSSWTSRSLLTRLARLALQGGLLMSSMILFESQKRWNAENGVITYRRSLRTRESNITRLASGSSWARGAGATILTSGTLEYAKAMFLEMTVGHSEMCVYYVYKQRSYSQQALPFQGVQNCQGYQGDPEKI